MDENNFKENHRFKVFNPQETTSIVKDQDPKIDFELLSMKAVTAY